jgi:hypothetical protein
MAAPKYRPLCSAAAPSVSAWAVAEPVDMTTPVAARPPVTTTATAALTSRRPRRVGDLLITWNLFLPVGRQGEPVRSGGA